MELTRHAIEKCLVYGVDAELLLTACKSGERLMDLRQGATLIQVLTFQSRPWVAVVNPVSNAVITVYPTDQRTIQSRRSSGRWRTTRP